MGAFDDRSSCDCCSLSVCRAAVGEPRQAPGANRNRVRARLAAERQDVRELNQWPVVAIEACSWPNHPADVPAAILVPTSDANSASGQARALERNSACEMWSKTGGTRAETRTSEPPLRSAV